jgi:arylsulfatase A-like enzyme
MKNVVMISVDDLFAYQKFRTTFGVTIRTPNFDRLAAAGTEFTNAFATTPLCSPSRASVLTGRSPFQTGIFSNAENFYQMLPPGQTLPFAFDRAGYQTGIFGKNFHSFDLQQGYGQLVADVVVNSLGLKSQTFGQPNGAGPAPSGVTDSDFAD